MLQWVNWFGFAKGSIIGNIIMLKLQKKNAVSAGNIIIFTIIYQIDPIAVKGVWRFSKRKMKIFFVKANVLLLWTCFDCLGVCGEKSSVWISLCYGGRKFNFPCYSLEFEEDGGADGD